MMKFFIFMHIIFYSMVLKTRPDWPVTVPVRPPAGHGSGPVRPIRPKSGQARIGPAKPVVRPVNRMNQTVFSESSDSTFFFPSTVVVPTGKTPRPRWNPPPRVGKPSPFCPPEPISSSVAIGHASQLSPTEL